MKKIPLILIIVLLLNIPIYAVVNCEQTQNIQSFVKRFYLKTLERTADNAGLDNWTNQLITKEKTGADVAKGFIFSDEFINKKKDDNAYVKILYRSLFNRKYDVLGLDNWISQLSMGVKREEILDGFLHSQEFINLSNSYGIQAYEGAAFRTEPLDNFVKRFYSEILGREADALGLTDWTIKLSTGVATGSDLAFGFIFSTEFLNKNIDNTTFLNVLYKAFFNREADSSGFNDWLGKLNNGMSREEVLTNFLHSQEFIDLANSYNIVAFIGAPKSMPIDNIAPTANAGSNQVSFLNDNITLDGLQSFDSDGNIICYWWHEQKSDRILNDTSRFIKSDFLVGTHSITLTIVDNNGKSASDSMTLEINKDDALDTPIAYPQDITVDMNSDGYSIVLKGTDNDSAITYTIVTQPAHGVLSGTAPNLTYIPNDGFQGEDSFTFSVNDGDYESEVVTVNIVVRRPNGYADLGAYTPKLYTNNKSGNNRYIAYYPENAISADMPVVMFIKGGGSATIESYRGIMKFMASKGYYVIGVDTNSYASRYVTQKLEIALNEVKERHGLTVSKLAIMGHSLGGGQAFYAMKKFRDDGYGNEGNLALSIDGWFAFNMDQIDLNLLDTKVSFLQMNGVHGTGTDPRIDLKIWNLATQSEKAFYTLPSTNHSYVAGNLASVLHKQDLLFSIGALTDDAFKGINDGSIAIPETNKATYSDIFNALKAEDDYHGGDCKGIQYNAITVIKNNDINYCDVESSYPPETILTKKVVNSVDKPLEKFSSYLELAFDSTVKRSVTRVTNREQDHKGFNGHQYPKQGSAWNSDMSLFRLVGRVYDAETLKEIPLTKTKTSGEVYSLMKAPQSGSSGIRWSKHDPDILYVMSAEKKFYKLTISPNKTTMSEEVIIDLSASERPFFNIGQNEGNIDYEDKYVVLTSLDGNDTYAALLDIKGKNLVWGPQKLDFSKSNFDWMSISPSGNYILISADSIIRLYNRNLDFIRVLANRAEHGDIGYDQNGNEMYVQFHSGGVGIFGFVLNDNPDYEEPIKLLDSNHGGGHISCRNYKRKGWCYVSTREDGYREVYALKLDGSKTVQRFAKTNARGSEDPRLGDDTHYYYATYPTAVPSPYGSRVLFWSDYGNAEGFLYYYKGNDDKWHTTDHYDNRDTYQVRISK